MVSATLFLSLISNASWNDNLTFGDTNSEYQLSSQVSSQCSRYELSSQVPVSTQCCRSVRVRDAGDAGPGQDGPPQELQHQDLRRPLAHIALHHQRGVTQLLLDFLNFVINI